MPDLVYNKFLSYGKIVLEFRINKYLRMHYKDEELLRKYFFSSLDGNRYEAVEGSESHIKCRYVDYGITEQKVTSELLRLPPIERVSKSRVYGLLLFPKMHELLQKLPPIHFLELTDYHINKPLARPLKKKRVENLGLRKGKMLLWEKLQFEKIKNFSLEHKELWLKLGTYPYLYELYNNNKSEEVYNLCNLISDLLKKLNIKSHTTPVTSNKSCLKRKQYILNYDESMVEQAKKNAMKRVTKEDLRRRQEYIASKLKQSNELFEVQRKLLSSSNNIDSNHKVHVMEQPICIRLLEPLEMLKHFMFEKKVVKENDNTENEDPKVAQ